jgi:hypothetical protein
VRNQRSGNERYFAKRRSNGDEREELFVVEEEEELIGITVANDGDDSSVAKR